MDNRVPFLEVRHMNKSFSTNQVLRDVNVKFYYDEVLGLMGENGAGKSTLIKIITGVYQKDSGDIIIDGEKVEIKSRQDAAKHGISVIYQELSLIPTLTVMENIFLGWEETKGRLFLNKKAMRNRVKHMIAKTDFDIDPDDVIENLTIAKRQTVEILKSLLLDAKMIIMDEPTASLNQSETERLFKIVRRLRNEGKCIVYISHRLDEIYELADRLEVLRDGVRVGELPKEEIEPFKVIGMMLGRTLDKEKTEYHQAADDAHVLKLEGIKDEDILDGIDLEVHSGQILGLTGLVGSGRTELLKSVFRLNKSASGKITYDGKEYGKTTNAAMTFGIGLIPEDRRMEGVVPVLSVERNIALASYDQNSQFGFVKKSKEEANAEELIKKIDIRPGNRYLKTGNLSGGNQQKVVIAKWLCRDLKVLLVDEPTVGIDVGAKSEIYTILRRLADTGCIVIVATSDLEELLQISDDIVVLVKGKIFKRMKNIDVTQSDVLAASSGLDGEAIA